MATRPFKSGNSQAVRIPADIAFKDMNEKLEVTRSGDTVMIRPVRGSMKEMVEILLRMPKPDTVELLDPIELPDRDWD